MRSITGYKTSGQTIEGNVERANDLNTFFNRFDVPMSHTSPGFSPNPHSPAPMSSPTQKSVTVTTPALPAINISVDQVKHGLRKISPTKAVGPDKINPRVLKSSAPQLCGVLQYLFSLSLSLQKVPALWKTSCIVPVPKTPRPCAQNDFRPVALTSHIMKVFERLILDTLCPLVKSSLDHL